MNVDEHIDDVTIRRKILPKIKGVFEKNQNDIKIIINVLQCLERTFDKLEKSQVRHFVLVHCFFVSWIGC